MSRIILAIFEADENIFVLFHDFLKKEKAEIIPLLDGEFAFLEAVVVVVVAVNEFLFHVFNLVVDGCIVKDYFSSMDILVRIPIVQIQTTIAM